ncbi:MAG: glycosyltransferase family 4 protein [candidate division KSB1 bacterium]|nr:glycosyltransferase family 4 protein [candidate division KSB1 bacterium]
MPYYRRRASSPGAQAHDRKLNLASIVRLLGSVDHHKIKKHYHWADSFVLPCIVEKNGNRDGIPNVLAEAMAMGLPVVSTPVSGIPELIVNNKTGLLAEPQNMTDLANKIEYLYKNKHEQKRLGANARDFVIRHFDSDKCLDQLFNFYKHVEHETHNQRR